MESWMINGSKVIMCHKSLADTPDDYAWQTDLELAHLTAMQPLTTSFTDYLLDYASQLRNQQPIKHQFAIKTRNGKHIGNCAYYGTNDNNGEVEIGIMIGNRSYWDRGYGTDAVTSLIKHVFLNTNFNRIHLKTLDTNKRAQKCFARCGFITCGSLIKDGYSFILMELYRNQWQMNKDKRL
jgi:RimJ/RimL family protein N-acetyltransferase